MKNKKISSLKPTQRQKASPPVESKPALLEEIKRLSQLAERVDEMMDEDRSLTDVLHALEGLGKNATRIGNLLKLVDALGGGYDAMEALNQALAEMIDDMKKQQPS